VYNLLRGFDRLNQQKDRLGRYNKQAEPLILKALPAKPTLRRKSRGEICHKTHK